MCLCMPQRYAARYRWTLEEDTAGGASAGGATTPEDTGGPAAKKAKTAAEDAGDAAPDEGAGLVKLVKGAGEPVSIKELHKMGQS